jgi:hypothetical protein
MTHENDSFESLPYPEERVCHVQVAITNNLAFQEEYVQVARRVRNGDEHCPPQCPGPKLKERKWPLNLLLNDIPLCPIRDR